MLCPRVTHPCTSVSCSIELFFYAGTRITAAVTRRIFSRSTADIARRLWGELERNVSADAMQRFQKYLIAVKFREMISM